MDHPIWMIHGVGDASIVMNAYQTWRQRSAGSRLWMLQREGPMTATMTITIGALYAGLLPVAPSVERA